MTARSVLQWVPSVEEYVMTQLKKMKRAATKMRKKCLWVFGVLVNYPAESSYVTSEKKIDFVIVRCDASEKWIWMFFILYDTSVSVNI